MNNSSFIYRYFNSDRFIHYKSGNEVMVDFVNDCKFFTPEEFYQIKREINELLESNEGNDIFLGVDLSKYLDLVENLPKIKELYNLLLLTNQLYDIQLIYAYRFENAIKKLETSPI